MSKNNQIQDSNNRVGNGTIKNNASQSGRKEVKMNKKNGADNGTTEDDASIFQRLEQPEVRGAIKMADIITVVDRRSGEVVPFWGRRFLQAVKDANQPKNAIAVYFKLDFESTEVEYLIAACCVLKGVPVKDANTELLSFLQESA